MHQLQIRASRASASQLLDHTKADPAAPVYRHTRRFVNGDQSFVFQQYWKLPCRGRCLGFGLHLRRNSDRGQAHPVPRLHPLIGAGAAFVHPHLTGSDDAIDVGFGHAFEVTHQKVIQTLARRIFVDLQHLGSGSGGWGICPYNVVH